MTLAPLPIDKELMPVAQRLANKALTRHAAGERKVDLSLSPQSSLCSGRIQLLVNDILSKQEGIIASVSGYTASGHLGVLVVSFSSSE